MTSPKQIRLRLVLATFWLAAAGTVPGAAAPPVRQSFDMRVPVPPTPVAVHGVPRLVYELRLTSFAREPLALRRLEVVDPRRAAVVAEMRGDALAQRVARLGEAPRSADSLTVAPGATAVVYLEVDLAAGGATPRSLVHRLELTRAGETETVEGAPTPVGNGAPPEIGPPLSGGPWAAVYHPSWERGHRRFLYAVGGRARIPGRFAIDWIRLDAEGREVHGDPDLVADWLGYGAPVLAVADAVVVAARDDVPESRRLSTHLEHPLEDATGNYVALDLGDGRFAFYEHLKPGSVRVAPGERVRRGQTIAALGFTGHSTGPHLHFHLADADSPLGAEGVPFVLDRFELLGAYDDVGLLGQERWTARDDATAATRTGEMPAPNAVVRFPAQASGPTP